MLIELIDLNSPPVGAVNCGKQKAMGKEQMRENRAWKINKKW